MLQTTKPNPFSDVQIFPFLIPDCTLNKSPVSIMFSFYKNTISNIFCSLIKQSGTVNKTDRKLGENNFRVRT